MKLLCYSHTTGCRVRRSCQHVELVVEKPMNLCACDSEERERGVGADVNVSILLMTGDDLLDGDTTTPVVSQRSE